MSPYPTHSCPASSRTVGTTRAEWDAGEGALLMQMRCYRCGFSFGISRESLETALAELTVSSNAYHVAYCPRCRNANKIDRQAIARLVPPPTEEALAAARTALES